ncbi:PHB depolymerase family esterase [Phenylobacterium sp.]|uniref:carboxylesterase family protein n=1 Tax=Phenylobacterium sp. TaxID=1871053 RepID=UPI00301D48AC
MALGAAIAMIAGVQAKAQLVDYEPAAKATPVQQDAAWRLAFRPGMQVLTQTVGQLRSGAPPAVQAQVDALVAEAAKQSEPEARRTLWRAVGLMGDQAWTPDRELLGAVALRTPSQIWTGAGDVLTAETLYPARGRVSYALDLYVSQPTTSATPKKGELIRRISQGSVETYPAPIAASLAGLPDGAYLLLAKVSAGAATTEIVQPVYLVRDLDARYAALKRELATIEGHEEAKALAEYPYALAHAMRAGQREVVSYDFPAATKRSADIVAALKAGRDPVRQARGLQNRAYRFAETGELIPFQVYVPSTWTPAKRWPLMVALHGANLDETNMLGRDGGRMQKLAEQHGVVVVTPLGYRLNSAYGSERGLAGLAGRDMTRVKRSEQDVLQVTALVEKEYNIDPARRYLTGNSMGGGGTWWIGGRHAQMWAAIAPGAYGGVIAEDVPALSKLPIRVIVGERDDLMLERVRETIATLKAGGVTPEYVEVPGGTHASAFETELPEIFKFFEKHAK